MKEQTAVEWLIDELTSNEHPEWVQEIFDQAKKMEKDQIIVAHFTSSGCNSFDIEESRVNSAYKAAQQYYNETYNKSIKNKG